MLLYVWSNLDCSYFVAGGLGAGPPGGPAGGVAAFSAPGAAGNPPCKTRPSSSFISTSSPPGCPFRFGCHDKVTFVPVTKSLGLKPCPEITDGDPVVTDTCSVARCSFK